MSSSLKNKLWFRAKNYGWGWYPVTWEGWLVIIAFVLILTIRGVNPSETYALEVFIAVIPLVLISYLKGEKPQWRWGNKK